MTVGGWFDTEDLRYHFTFTKPLKKTILKLKNSIVMGPFSHGGWSYEMGKTFS